MKKLIFFILLISGLPADAYGQQAAEQYNLQASALMSHYPDSAFILAGKALKLAREENDRYAEGYSLQLRGKVFFTQGIYTQSLENLLQAEAIFKELQHKQMLAENYHQQGLVYYHITQAEKAMELQNKALETYEDLGDQRGKALVYGAMGRLHEKSGTYDTALLYQEKALSYYNRLNDPSGKAGILENIGSIYEDLEQYDKAMQYFRESISLTELTGDSLLMIVNLNNIGDIHRKQEQYDEALRYTQAALTLAESLQDKYQLSSAYRDMAKIYEAQGAYALAYQHHQTGQKLYKEMYAQETARQLTQLQTLYEVERKDFEIYRLENARTLDRLIKASLGSGLFLIGLLAFVITNRQQLRIRRKQEMLERHDKVHQAEKKLMQTVLENRQLLEEKLQQELESGHKSLTAHTLHIIGKNKILEELRSKLNGMLNNDPDLKLLRKQIKQLVKMIDHNFTQDKDWDDFRNIFEQVHQDFFDKLHQHSPELSPGDLRLAALLRLNMQSKDITTILGIAPNSLRIARYRLKKKLQLDPDESLTSFILSI